MEAPLNGLKVLICTQNVAVASAVLHTKHSVPSALVIFPTKMVLIAILFFCLFFFSYEKVTSNGIITSYSQMINLPQSLTFTPMNICDQTA